MTFVRGPARVGRRTKELAKRLRGGEIAVIDHRDIDGVAAESLVACRVSAVLNASESISGRYPNRGPAILLKAGIPIIDAIGPDVMTSLKDGDVVEVDLTTGTIQNGAARWQGNVLTSERFAQRTEEARSNLHLELQRFAKNTLEYVSREEHILLDPIDFPPIQSRIKGRHVLVVVRGEGFREDLKAIRTYIDEVKPTVIAVDGGADALLEMGLTPQVILGDMDSVTDASLRCGAELIVHAYSDGRAPGSSRLADLGLSYQIVRATGTSEDIAMLLAYEKGAELVVAVGTHSSLVDFLDKGRPGMSSTFLTRLRIGSRFVDARGVSQLYHRRLRWYHVVVPLVIATLLFAIALSYSTGFRVVIREFLMEWTLRRH